MGFNINEIPAEMKAIPNWVCWKAVPDPKSHSGVSKRPINPRTGGNAQSNNPETWADFDTACNAAQSRGLAGIGFMFSNTPFFGVDVDDRPLDSPEVQEILTAIPSYAELSQSGHGVHIICSGSLPGKGFNNHNTGVEMYENERFFVVTGNRVSNERHVIDCTEQVKPVYALHDTHKGGAPTAPRSAPPATFPSFDALTVNGIIDKALNSRQGEEFGKLMSGDCSGYESQSEAEMAFCNMLAFWTGRNPALMDAIYRQSKLMRAKWDRKQSGTTYGAITIQKAIDGCKTVYGEGRGVNLTDAFGSITPGYSAPAVPEVSDEDLLADFHTADTYKEVPVKWLWRGRIPLGYITFLMSPGGCGKSYLSCAIAAAASTGRALFDDDDAEPGKVLYLSCEDSGDVIRKRLERCGANLKNVIIQDLDAKFPLYFPDSVDDTKTMARWDTVMSHVKPVLVICDVWHGLCNTERDLNKQNSVRGILRGVAKVAKTYGAAFVLIAHTNKSRQFSNINDTMMGSSDAVNAARSVLAVIFNSDTQERVLIHSKINDGKLEKSVKFSVDGNGVTFDSFSPITRATYELAMQNHRTPWQEIDRQAKTQIDESILLATLADIAQLGKTVTVTYEEVTEAAGYDIFAGNQPGRVLERLRRDDLLSRGLSISDIGAAFTRNSKKKRGFRLSCNTTAEEMTSALPK